MMCESCKEIAAENLLRVSFSLKRQLSHTRKQKPHCEYPETCTCRHQPVADGYVNRDGVA